MANSIKKNFSYNLVLTLCNYLFPLLTYPYVSRVLGVDKIGTCNFVDSIINYFVLFSMLGISSFGVREIARNRENRDKRNEIFSNLFIINALCTTVSLVVLIICSYCIPSLCSYKEFLWVGVLKLVFNLFLVEWLFQGLQDFKYITIRSVFVRLLYVICVFVFIHDKDDALIYYLLTCCTIVVNAVYNWLYSKRFCSFDKKTVNLRLYVVPILTFGYYRILTSMYTSFNVVFLGFASGDVEVGYFTTATKLYSIIMGVFTAFTTVMIPKVSELLSKGEVSKLQDIAKETFSLLTVLSLPIIYFCCFFASDIITLLSGPGFEGAYLPFKIVIFLLLIIGAEQIVVQQFLMASKKSSPIAVLSTVGAVVGISVNCIITPKYGAVGSSIAWGISELSVLLLGLHYLNKEVGIKIDTNNTLLDVAYSTLYFFPLLLINRFVLLRYLAIVLSLLSTFIIFVIINFVLRKNNTLVGIWNNVKRETSVKY